MQWRAADWFWNKNNSVIVVSKQKEAGIKIVS